MDSPPEEAFDRFTRLAAQFLAVPVALVSLVDEQRQYFKSCIGLPEPLASVRQTPLSHSFCKHVVESGEPLIVADASHHPLVRDNLALRDLGVVAYAGIPLRGASGHVFGSFCVIDVRARTWTSSEIALLQDLAAAVTAEISLRQARDDAERANQAKDRFLAVLSHELRTPLTPALITATAMLQDTSLPESVREDARTIKRNIEVETRLIDDLLDVTRVASGKVEFRAETVDVNEVINDCNTVCHATAAGEPKVAFHLKLSAKHTHVKGDPARLRQIFSNLISNALKFTPAGGTVTLSTSDAAESRLQITVKDTGIGIAPHLLPRVFDAFEQGGRHITQEHAGLGLGLAIAKGFVEAHGGTITAASSGPGAGTTMTVLLPTIPAPAPVSRPGVVETAPDERPVRPVRILLVEDHEDSLNAMSKILRRMLGHDVATAADVKTALQIAEQFDFDLLISDVGLPDRSGLELMRELCATRPATRPVRGIALTGYGTVADMEQTTDAGFAMHLTKPVGVAALVDAVRRMTAIIQP